MEVKDITNLIMENILQYIHVLDHHTLNLHNVIPQFNLYKGWEKNRIENSYKNERTPGNHNIPMVSEAKYTFEKLYMYFSEPFIPLLTNSFMDAFIPQIQWIWTERLLHVRHSVV